MEDNVFEILGVDKREHSFSDLLKWISTQKSNFVKSLLRELNHSYEVDDIKVKREVERSKSRADLRIKGGDFLIILENKVKSTEHENQTRDLYADWKDIERDPIFVFLTPEYRESPECEEFTHITYTQIRDILSNLKENFENEKRKIFIEDFIEALEVNKFVKFEKFSEKSTDYLEELTEFREKEKEWYSEVEQFFNEIGTRVKEELDNDYEMETTKTSLKIGKEEWGDSAYYKVAIGDKDKRKGRIRIYLSVGKSDERENQYNKFQERIEGKNKPENSKFRSSEAHWWEERHGEDFREIMDNSGKNLPKKLSKKVEKIVEKTEPLVDDLVT